MVYLHLSYVAQKMVAIAAASHSEGIHHYQSFNFNFQFSHFHDNDQELLATEGYSDDSENVKECAYNFSHILRRHIHMYAHKNDIYSLGLLCNINAAEPGIILLSS